MKQIMISVLVALVCVLGLSPGEVDAGGRTSCYSYPGSCYSYPTQSYEPTYYYRDVIREVPVAYPVPFTVAVPVVSYLYNGGGYSYSPVYQAQPASGMGTVSYNGGQPPQQQPPPAQPPPQAGASDPSQFTDAQIDSLIARIEQRLDARRNGDKAPPPAAAPPPTATLDALSILTLKRGNSQKSCMDCHTGAAAKGKMVIFTAPGQLNPKANWVAIWDATDAGRMPPEAKSNRNALLSDQEVNILEAKKNEGRQSRR